MHDEGKLRNLFVECFGCKESRQSHQFEEVSEQMSVQYLGCNFVIELNKENYSRATILIKS